MCLKLDGTHLKQFKIQRKNPLPQKEKNLGPWGAWFTSLIANNFYAYHYFSPCLAQ
jgi:hypothetical protein